LLVTLSSVFIPGSLLFPEGHYTYLSLNVCK
jgi:hypothetical protein